MTVPSIHRLLVVTTGNIDDVVVVMTVSDEMVNVVVAVTVLVANLYARFCVVGTNVNLDVVVVAPSDRTPKWVTVTGEPG